MLMRHESLMRLKVIVIDKDRPWDGVRIALQDKYAS